MSDSRDPWSGDVPVTPPPFEFVFGHIDPPQPSSGEPAFPRNIEPSQPVGPRRRLVGVGLAVGVIAIVAIGLTQFGGDNSSSADPANSAPSDSLPGSSLEAVDTEPSRTTEPSDRTTSTTEAPFDVVAEGEELPGVWVTGDIEIPDRFAAMTAPTQLDVLTSKGVYIQIDLSTGTTSSFDLDRPMWSDQLRVGRTTTLISSNSDPLGAIVLLSSGQQPIEVDLDSATNGLYFHEADTSRDEFTANVWVDGGGDSLRPRTVVIRADGSVEEVDNPPGNQWDYFVMATGERLISDAGGLYLQADDGATRRISTGSVLGRSQSFLLVRECDEQRMCGYTIIDVLTGERSPAAFPDSQEALEWLGYGANGLSPDGRTLMLQYGFDTLPELLDLVTGDRTTIEVSINDQNGESAATWAPDSSGIFTLEGGEIQFLDRTNGEVTSFPLELASNDPVIDVGARAMLQPAD